MGIIDSTYYRLTCENCGTAETLASHQRGSSWSPGEWGQLGAAKFFDTEIDPGNKGSGPDVVSATCKKCNAEAKIENHMYSKPAGW